MARIKDREQALNLRSKGMSYSQIKEVLRLSKSTLSLWLRNYPLSKEQIDNLRGKNPKRIEKFIETMRLKRKKRLHATYSTQKGSLLPLSKRELFIAGLFLYWGEGAKTQGAVSINNTDPKMLKFALFWINTILKVPKSKIKVYLHLYNDMNINKEIDFWCKILDIPSKQFSKPYIKSSSRENLTHKGFGHGTCGLLVNNTLLKERVMMAIAAIADNYSEKT